MKIEELLRQQMKEANCKYGVSVKVGTDENGISKSVTTYSSIPITQEVIEDLRNNAMDDQYQAVMEDPIFIELEDHEMKKVAAATGSGCLPPIFGLLMVVISVTTWTLF